MSKPDGLNAQHLSGREDTPARSSIAGECVIQLREAEYVQARQLWHQLHSRMSLAGRVAFAVLCVGFALYGGWAGAGLTSLSMLAMACLVLLPLWLLPWRWRRSYRRHLLPQYPLHFRWQDDSLHVEAANGQHWQGRLSSLQGYLLTEHCLFLIHDAKHHHISLLPVNSTTQPLIQQLQSLVDAYIPA